MLAAIFFRRPDLTRWRHCRRWCHCRRRYRMGGPRDQKIRRTRIWLLPSTEFLVISAAAQSIRLIDVGLLISPPFPLLSSRSNRCVPPLRGFRGDIVPLCHCHELKNPSFKICKSVQAIKIVSAYPHLHEPASRFAIWKHAPLRSLVQCSVAVRGLRAEWLIASVLVAI